jgi:hypothetical protein
MECHSRGQPLQSENPLHRGAGPEIGAPEAFRAGGRLRGREIRRLDRTSAAELRSGNDEIDR